MFRFWGDGSQEAMNLVQSIRVRSTDHFNWTFIFILAVVFYVYWSEIHKKNYEARIKMLTDRAKAKDPKKNDLDLGEIFYIEILKAYIANFRVGNITAEKLTERQKAIEYNQDQDRNHFYDPGYHAISSSHRLCLYHVW